MTGSAYDFAERVTAQTPIRDALPSPEQENAPLEPATHIRKVCVKVYGMTAAVDATNAPKLGEEGPWLKHANQVGVAWVDLDKTQGATAGQTVAVEVDGPQATGGLTHFYASVFVWDSYGNGPIGGVARMPGATAWNTRPPVQLAVVTSVVIPPPKPPVPPEPQPPACTTTLASRLTVTTNSSTYLFLDRVAVSGTLKQTDGTPIPGQTVRLTFRNGSTSGTAMVTVTVKTSSSGTYSYAYEGPNLYPGASRRTYVVAEHIPTSGVQKAPTVNRAYTMNPFNVVATMYHVNAWGKSEGYYGNPWGARGGFPRVPNQVNSRTPYVTMNLSSSPRRQASEMSKHNLWGQVKVDMGFQLLSNLSTTWKPRAGGVDTGVQGERLQRRPGPVRQQEQGRVGVQGSAVQRSRSAPRPSGRKLIGPQLKDGNSTIWFGFDVDSLGFSGAQKSRALAQTRGKGVAMCVIWGTVKNDSSGKNRWRGGAYKTNPGSTGGAVWAPGAWNPTFAPIVFVGTTNSGVPRDGGHRI